MRTAIANFVSKESLLKKEPRQNRPVILCNICIKRIEEYLPKPEKKGKLDDLDESMADITLSEEDGYNARISGNLVVSTINITSI